jgi:hypothetical protein
LPHADSDSDDFSSPFKPVKMVQISWYWLAFHFARVVALIWLQISIRLSEWG